MPINNNFVSLAVPNGAGIGAPADISLLSRGLSLIVGGPRTSTGEILIEISGDGGQFAAATAVFPINNPPAEQLNLVARFARVRRVSGSGSAFVALGGTNTSMNLFGTLSLAPLDTSEFGPFKTIIVVGDYQGSIVIEGSNDGGATFDAVASFNTQASDVLTVEGTWGVMRARPGANLNNVVLFLGSGVDSSTGVLRSELGKNDRDGFGMDMLGIVHTRNFVDWFPTEITNGMDALFNTKGVALDALEKANVALSTGILRYGAQVSFTDVFTQPAGTKQASFEFEGGTPLGPEARFMIAQFLQFNTWSNTGGTLIQASIGVFGDLEKYAAKVDITNPANAGKTFTSNGDAGLFLLAPIGGDAPLVTIYSVDDLNTVLSGLIATDLFYSKP